MEVLQDIVIHQLGLGETFYAQLQEISKEVKLQKKEMLIREGDICSFIGFMQSGVLRSYILNEGNEFTVDFYLPGSFVSSYTSFLTQLPSVGYIQALSASVLYTFNHTAFNQLLHSNPVGYQFAKYISDTLFIKKCKRETSLLMEAAADRYKFLLGLYPHIEQLVPQYHIASYLGIKPESLSRMKSLTYINEKQG